MSSLAGKYPNEVTVVEVGPRDGLQNEKVLIDTAKKVEFVDRLSLTGLRRIEVTSFVSPKWVPQLADSKAVMSGIQRHPLVRYSTLTPNLKGLRNAVCTNFFQLIIYSKLIQVFFLKVESKSEEVAIFGAASETFTKKNINCSIEQSLKNFEQVVQEARTNNLLIRGYVSCVVGCPYEGHIKPAAVAGVVEKMLSMGCYEVSLGDTIGVGNPNTVNALLSELRHCVGGDMSLLAMHCHDTYGMALVNILQALEHGIHVLDSSCAGLGGCPYAKGASGNVATEDVLYMLHGLGVKTGVSLEKILEASQFILASLNRNPVSKVAMAMAGNKCLPNQNII